MHACKCVCFFRQAGEGERRGNEGREEPLRKSVSETKCPSVLPKKNPLHSVKGRRVKKK